MHLNKAVAYMKAVIAKERCIPFNRFSGSIGRTAQTKEFKSPTSKGRWPEKSCRILLGMLKNAESNAEVKGLDVDALVIDHIQVKITNFSQTELGYNRLSKLSRIPSQILVKSYRLIMFPIRITFTSWDIFGKLLHLQYHPKIWDLWV